MTTREKQREYSKIFRAKHGSRKLSKDEKLKQKQYLHNYNKINAKLLNEKKRIRLSLKSDAEKERIKQRKRDWNTKNKEWINTYHRERKQSDPLYKIKCYLRTRLYQAIKGHNKGMSASKLLDCSIVDFKAYIASKFTEGMSWDNHGEWELDHIMPLSLFNLLDVKECSKAFSLY